MEDTYFLMKIKDASIYIKRDDLLPFSFGGNKLRIVTKAFEDMERRGCDEFISYGSESSNLNRVAAHMARSRGVACTVIFKKGRGAHEPYNELLVKESGARIVYCEGSEVRAAVEEELRRSVRDGHRPYYIYGDSNGRGNEACLVEAYVEAYEEIRDFEAKSGISFSHIFLASGTGITQSGLMAASILHGDDKKICGISVARSRDRGREAIRENMSSYMRDGRKTEVKVPAASEIFFDDRFVKGGYGCADQELSELCRQMMKGYGLPLDTTYTGKAFLGMRNIIEEEHIKGSVLFIHTGGLPGVFDAARDIMLS